MTKELDKRILLPEFQATIGGLQAREMLGIAKKRTIDPQILKEMAALAGENLGGYFGALMGQKQVLLKEIAVLEQLMTGGAGGNILSKIGEGDGKDSNNNQPVRMRQADSLDEAVRRYKTGQPLSLPRAQRIFSSPNEASHFFQKTLKRPEKKEYVNIQHQLEKEVEEAISRLPGLLSSPGEKMWEELAVLHDAICFADRVLTEAARERQIIPLIQVVERINTMLQKRGLHPSDFFSQNLLRIYPACLKYAERFLATLQDIEERMPDQEEMREGVIFLERQVEELSQLQAELLALVNQVVAEDQQVLVAASSEDSPFREKGFELYPFKIVGKEEARAKFHPRQLTYDQYSNYGGIFAFFLYGAGFSQEISQRLSVLELSDQLSSNILYTARYVGTGYRSETIAFSRFLHHSKEKLENIYQFFSRLREEKKDLLSEGSLWHPDLIAEDMREVADDRLEGQVVLSLPSGFYYLVNYLKNKIQVLCFTPLLERCIQAGCDDPLLIHFIDPPSESDIRIKLGGMPEIIKGLPFPIFTLANNCQIALMGFDTRLALASREKPALLG